MPEPTEIEKALAWLIDHSDGVVGLRADGEMTPWEKVLALYLPWLSGDFADRELERETGVAGVTYDIEDDDDA